MKSTLFAAAIACILSVTLAVESDKLEHVNAEVTEYIRERMIDFPMMRSSVDHFVCYDDLTRKITTITESANEKSERCIKSANEQKTLTLEQLKQARTEVAPNVSSVHNSFFGCARIGVGLEYFECLKTAVQADEGLLQSILAKSQQVLDQYSGDMRNIETQENTCLQNAIDEAKSLTEQSFEQLRTCIASN